MSLLSRAPILLMIFFGCLCSFSVATSFSEVPTVKAQSDPQAARLAEIERVRQKLAQSPNNAGLHYFLGRLYQSLVRWPEAIESLSNATHLDPNWARAWYDLGWCHYSQGKYVEALAAHEQAAAKAQAVKSANAAGVTFSAGGTPVLGLREPAQTEAWLAVGLDYFLLKRYDEALSAYQKALELDDHFVDALYEIGRMHLSRGDREQASQVATKLSAPHREWLLKELSLLPPVPQVRAGETAVAATRTELQTPPSSSAGQSESLPMSTSLRPKILFKERAKYTEEARANQIQGSVLLSVVYAADGRISSVRVTRGLPYGLTATALAAAEKIRFEPAQKDGQAVSVRGSVEFNFSLY